MLSEVRCPNKLASVSGSPASCCWHGTACRIRPCWRRCGHTGDAVHVQAVQGLHGDAPHLRRLNLLSSAHLHGRGINLNSCHQCSL